MTDRVLGIDACKTGWVGISLDEDSVRGWHAATIGELVQQVTDDAKPAVVAIDIPIGLPTSGIRKADSHARRLLGARSSSIFTTLVRAAYEAPDFAAAGVAQRSATGVGTTQQGWGLRHKVLEVDTWLADRDLDDDTVVECHPEVSFAAMNGGDPLAVSKKTWSGHALRRELLATQGIEIPVDLGTAGRKAGVDDVLDAAAAAWTAQRVRAGEGVSLPERPEQLGDRRAAIVY